MVSTTQIIIGIAIFFCLEFFIFAPLISDSYTWGNLNTGSGEIKRPTNLAQGDYDTPTGDFGTILHPISYLDAAFSLFNFGVSLPDDYPTLFISFISIINYICILSLIVAIVLIIRSGANA